MSFSKTIKEELSKISNFFDKKAIKFELLGYFMSNNTKFIQNEIKYATENEYNINRFAKILENIEVENYKIELKGNTYHINIHKKNIKELDEIMKLPLIEKKQDNNLKSIIRGVFLGAGSMNNPNKKYHLEMLVSKKEYAEYIEQILKEFGIKIKKLNKEASCSLYIKEAEEISKFLAFMGANKSVLDFEEIRVIRDTKNRINRMVNCETYNLEKSVKAGVKQIQAINQIKQKGKFEELPEYLKEMANLRLKNPEASLVELGKMLENPIGKSGVNHRLRQICEIAQEC